jgi:hypothetical protein
MTHSGQLAAIFPYCPKSDTPMTIYGVEYNRKLFINANIQQFRMVGFSCKIGTLSATIPATKQEFVHQPR